MRKWFNNNKLNVAGTIVGGMAGYFYWQQIGCSSGTCLITSKPVNSTIYGMLLGALLFNMLKKEKTKQTLKDE